MIMTNIPRRKIYELMLQFEEFVLEIQILLFDKNNFDKYKDKYGNSLESAYKKYKEIKALLVMFYDNEKFENENDFQAKFSYYMTNEKDVNLYLKKEKRFPSDAKKLILQLDKESKENQKIAHINHGTKLFASLDEFNSLIPKLLEMRR